MYAVSMPGRVGAGDVSLRLGNRLGFVWCAGTPGYGEEGRWSFLGSDPVEVVRVPMGDRDPLAALEKLGTALEESPVSAGQAPPPDRVPRWAGYIAYDAHWSCRPRRLQSSSGLPALWFGRYDAWVAIDHVRGRSFVVGDDRISCERLMSYLDRSPVFPEAYAGEIEADDRAEHARAIRAALEHIAAGDIYQVNLARCWNASYHGSPLALWLRMREASPVPLGFYLQVGDHAVLAGTMERFIGWEGPGGELLSRPIKGTIERCGTRDFSEGQKLLSDEKERAEHTMIVDLMRNDLGRVAQIGSVKVKEIMAVEPYSRLLHLVSTVSCVTRPEVSIRDVMEATFPPGSVTGAPKLRAVEIIEALERVPRGVYTGAVGYLDRAGGASFAVAIRTAVIHQEKVRYLAGGGVVAASDVDKEIAETELKTRFFVDALQALGRSDRPRFPVGASDFALNSSPRSGVVQG